MGLIQTNWKHKILYDVQRNGERKRRWTKSKQKE